MASEPFFEVERQGGGAVLRLSGRLDRDRAGELAAALERATPGPGGALAIDLSRVEHLDSAAVAALVAAVRRTKASGARVELSAASDAARRSLAMFRLREPPPPPGEPPGVVEAMGHGLVEGGLGARQLLQLAADATFGLASLAAHPGRVRWGALVEQGIHIGSKALPIVGLISFLVGLTLAFQSAYQLRQFGAAIFVANLTGVAMVREMGPLMTAILVAGRSGSSIAAEIATMKVSEEIDALTVMGLDPVGYLALPRLLAITLALPLLTVLADLCGIAGGFLVGVAYLDLSPVAFANQMLDALGAWDLASGLVKSVAFGWGIGLIGLFYGFRVQGGAAEVGRTTTASVVAAIFYIIVADCLFSVLFYVVL